MSASINYVLWSKVDELVKMEEGGNFGSGKVFSWGNKEVDQMSFPK